MGGAFLAASTGTASAPPSVGTETKKCIFPGNPVPGGGSAEGLGIETHGK